VDVRVQPSRTQVLANAGAERSRSEANAALEPPTGGTTGTGRERERQPPPIQKIHQAPLEKQNDPLAIPEFLVREKKIEKAQPQENGNGAVSCGSVEGHTDRTQRPEVGEASVITEVGRHASRAARGEVITEPPLELTRDDEPQPVVEPGPQDTKSSAGNPGNPPKEVSGVWTTIIETYRDRPIQFVEDLLLRNYPDFKLEAWQKRFLKALGRGERRISVRAGHGVGKSAACSWGLIWHLFTRFPQKSVLTAPTQSQLFDALFSEVKKWVNELPRFMRDQVEVFSDRIELKASPENSFMSARTSSSERPEALAGIHSEHVLLVVDEASAVPEAVFEAASGSMSGFTATTILISNPTRNTGLFFKTHHQLSDQWFRLHVSCLDSRLVSPDFVEQIKSTYGETSSAYFVRVLGEFAPREDDVLIPAELVDAAMSRDVVLDTGEPLFYGLDVARFGDDRTVLVKRQGNVVIEYRSWSGADLMHTVGRVMSEAANDKPAEIMVDAIGLGAGVADRLREQGLNIRDVNVAEVSALNPIASKLRDEIWLTLKDWLSKRACRLPRSEELRGELVGPTYTFLSNGKIKVEAKVDMKRRGLRSPDIADALCLTFAGQGAMVGGRASHWVKGKPLLRSIRGVV
jgi:hypothetical protein